MRFVHKLVTPLAVDVGDAHGETVGDLAHKVFTVGQAPFQLFAQSDVLKCADQPYRRAIFKLCLTHRTYPDRTSGGGDER